MSRHSIPSKDPNHTVVVGWDPPLQTFFAQVRFVEVELADDDEAEPEYFLDEGNTFQQHPILDNLLHLLAPFADVPDTTKLQLANDKATSTKPSALQVEMVKFLSRVS